ncbi:MULTISPECIES: diacylglycerol kinase family protein [Flavobacterium]|uniref:diacylglycerol/lipid kinase family protein n=1 Tax=Flavobacterium TaxID=237 RepID=UPI00095EA203|nr:MULTISPECIES: diacylglycerol kinase family protein [Flavobacterium]MBN9284525.1 diacylglycerol kinase family lipid kinase [Flavobacterium sp.]OJV72820.1 MAG: lipid kinase [Flavobacterium sp. 40-81]
MKYIHFIVNPISGKGKHKIRKEDLEAFFPSNEYKIVVDYSEYKKHAIELTKNAVAKNPEMIVACGGDGTIHEVASGLVNTSIALGILPVGSGNGLASNLSIPKDFEKAIRIIKQGNESAIDVGSINNHYFFSNMGLGIDALIIKKYENMPTRNLSTYVKASLQSAMGYKANKAIVHCNDTVFEVNPMLLFISNSNEMGYNMSLTPKASLQDGWLDLLVVSKLNIFEQLYFGSLVLMSKTEKFKKANSQLVKEVKIEMENKDSIAMQLDGEYYESKTNIFKISILEGSLKVVN